MNLNIYFIFVGLFTLFLEIIFDNPGLRIVIVFIFGFLLGIEVHYKRK